MVVLNASSYKKYTCAWSNAVRIELHPTELGPRQIRDAEPGGGASDQLFWLWAQEGVGVGI